ncbi:MAG: exodeoxyribonuclease VII small subunit [Planctomycetota bacterium]|jgi:exodeoxyribonuclease VII small subunit
MAKKKTSTKKQTALPDFEKAIEQIEAITSTIEEGEIGLEESLEHYEKGIELIRQCRATLDRVEQRIQELNELAEAEEPPPDGSMDS